MVLSTQSLPEASEALPVLLKRVLTATTSSEVCQRVMQRSLSLAGLVQVPNESQAMRAYVEGPLQRVLLQTVGVHVASAVFESLRPLLETSQAKEDESETWEDYGTSDLFRLQIKETTAQISRLELLRREPLPKAQAASLPAKSWTAAETSAPPSNSPVAPIILVSADHTGIQRMLKQLRPVWQALPVSTNEQLQVALRQPEGCPKPIVVLDFSMPSLQLEELLERSSMLAAARRIVVWGITARRRKELEVAFAQDLGRWTMLPMFVGYQELAETLVALAEDG